MAFTTTEILKSIQPVLNLARATATELSEATNLAAAAMRSFGLDASQMERVVDVMAATTNKSALVLTELGEALKFVAPLARATGEGIEETSAAIGILADNGIRGTRAGTALARAYKNLTKEATQETLKKIGVNAADANNNLRPIADIIADIGKATSGLGSAARLAQFEKLFGRGTAAAINLANSSAKIKIFTADLRNAAGEAQRVSDAMDKTLGGSFRLFISALEGVAIEIGVILAPAVSALIKMVTTALGAVVRFIKANKGLILSITAVAVALIVIGGALLGIGLAASVIAFAIQGLVAVFGLLATVVGFILSPLGLFAIALGVAVIAILKFTAIGATAISFLGETFGTLFSNVSKVLTAIVNALLAGDIKLASDILWLSLKVVFLKGTLELLKVWKSFSDKFLTAIINTFFDSVEDATNFWNDLKIAWVIGGDSLLSSLRKFAASASVIWQGLEDSAAKAFLAIIEFGKEALKPVGQRDFAAAQARFDAGAANLDAQGAAVVAEIKSTLKSDLADIDSAQQKAILQIESDRAEQIAGIGGPAVPSAIDTRISATQKALAKAIKNLEVKVGEGLELGGVDFEKFRDEVNKLIDSLLGRGGQADQVETRGFFSSAAIERAGSSTASLRAQRAAITTAQNSVLTSANTKKTAANTAKTFRFGNQSQ